MLRILWLLRLLRPFQQCQSWRFRQLRQLREEEANRPNCHRNRNLSQLWWARRVRVSWRAVRPIWGTASATITPVPTRPSIVARRRPWSATGKASARIDCTRNRIWPLSKLPDFHRCLRRCRYRPPAQVEHRWLLKMNCSRIAVIECLLVPCGPTIFWGLFVFFLFCCFFFFFTKLRD